MTATEKMAERIPSRFEAAASFVRLSALGVTVFLAFLGAASSTVGLPARPRPIISLVLAAVAFHIFAYVSNDVVDLPIDRTAPARWPSPLVRGMIHRWQALTTALAQVPIAAGVAWWGGGGIRGIAALLLACCLMTMYNLWGKRFKFPPLTDLVQGLGWAAFTYFGATIAEGPGLDTANVLLFVTIYIVMANGVHGSIRDLRNDLRYGVRSTAILLGARPGAGQTIILPRRLVAYALALQVVLTGTILVGAIGSDAQVGLTTRSIIVALVAVLSVICLVLFGAALRGVQDERLLWAGGTLHLIATMALSIVFVVGHLSGWMTVVLIAGYFLPFLLNGWLPEALRRARRRRRLIRPCRVHWFNETRLYGPIGHTPPIKCETEVLLSDDGPTAADAERIRSPLNRGLQFFRRK